MRWEGGAGCGSRRQRRTGSWKPFDRSPQALLEPSRGCGSRGACSLLHGDPSLRTWVRGQRILLNSYTRLVHGLSGQQASTNCDAPAGTTERLPNRFEQADETKSAARRLSVCCVVLGSGWLLCASSCSALPHHKSAGARQQTVNTRQRGA